MHYQDTWIEGESVSKGERECEDRYAIVRDFCAQYRRPFTVLDIGASICYFGIRLTEDFPNCTVAAIEHREAQSALDVLKANDAQRVILMSKLLRLDDLQALAEVETFDIVLALSIIHRFPGSFKDRLEVFRSLGDNLILEVPFEDCTGGNVNTDDSLLPADHKLLGYGKSHLVENGKRKIVLLPRQKTELKRAYFGCDRTDLRMVIYSDFYRKQVKFFNKKEQREWIRGLNLHTYLNFDGIWPERHTIRKQIEAKREAVLEAGHHDIAQWNIILQGDDSKFIDVRDPNIGVHEYPDAEYFEKLQGVLS